MCVIKMFLKYSKLLHMVSIHIRVSNKIRVADGIRRDELVSICEWMKIVTRSFEVAVRVMLNLQTLNLILKPQSAVFLGKLYIMD